MAIVCVAPSPSPSSQSIHSSPLSNLSKTPSPPPRSSFTRHPVPNSAERYPTPTSTSSGTSSPRKHDELVIESSINVHPLDMTDRDGPPPAKRRKTAPAPKERTTEYLDLTKANDDFDEEDTRQMDRLVTALRKKKKIVVIAGAGISVSAGIPDFRSSTGLFATARTQHKLKASGKHLFDASVYKHDATTQSFHTMVREMAEMTKNAQPTPFHHLLASLAQEGRLMRLYSQNIDCIDTNMKPLSTNVPLNAKGPWPATIQLHGGLQSMVCTKCGKLNPFEPELFDGPEAPLCKDCELTDVVRTTFGGKRSHGIGRLRPRFVLYNEYNPDEEAIGMVSSADLKTRPDAVIVVGTSLKVPGTRRLVRELCQATRSRKNGFTAWINTDSEPKGADFKVCWDMVVRAKCDDVARLVALPPWDCNIGDDYLVSKDSDSNISSSHSRFEVHIGSKSKHVEEAEAFITPHPSPKLSAMAKPPSRKQTTLSFGQTDTKPTKTSKPRSRKAKQAHTNADVSKNTILSTFKPVKHASKPYAKSDKHETGLPALRPPRSPSTEIYVKLEPDHAAGHAVPKSLINDTPFSESIPKDMRQPIQ
ncbi:DHS-like NAD/FAD-binding domain-containing protein [Stachybotrys elegans]|uniref:DHS-like NAD/FAD-binding domain-containing protein n=1 Tax=Stachybotrys elegans TaxID=80388 RepID=A0A8K0T6G0_9HYPO|nr:DHS-like NAD/FAD-binding domain-containing protein [Stachybotrys elegans]